MDRRSLLAILLSTIVLIAFNQFFMPKPKPRPHIAAPAAGAGDTSATGAAPASGQAAQPADLDSLLAPGAGIGLGQAPGASASTFPVTIDGVVARFTTRGGGIDSWRLNQFPGRDGEPVEMVRSGPEPRVVLHTSGRDLDLTNTIFTSEVSDIPGGGRLITFRAGGGSGLSITKRYRLMPNSPLYDIDIDVAGLPLSGGDSWLDVGWLGGIAEAEPLPQTDRTAAGAVIAVGKEIDRLPTGTFRKEHSRVVPGQIHWVAARIKYFMATIIPPEGAVTTAVASGDALTHVAGASVRFPISGAGDFHQSLKLYLGPIDYWKLKEVGFGLERAVDLGWKFILPVSQLLLWALNAGHRLIPNYGIVIILVSVLTRLLFYPLTKASIRSMRAMQQIQPEMERLRKKYEKDPQRLNQEVFALYKKHNVNPVSGCLPLILQMPVFFALYSVLANSVALRQAPFVGWITDLSAPDTLMTIGGFAIHVLPVLMALTMFWQQKLTPTDPRQAPVMLLMPFMMLFFFYKVPSGLTLYWTVTNLFSVLQQWQMNRETAAAREVAPA